LSRRLGAIALKRGWNLYACGINAWPQVEPAHSGNSLSTGENVDEAVSQNGQRFVTKLNPGNFREAQ
jgi:hypothetical protein